MLLIGEHNHRVNGRDVDDVTLGSESAYELLHVDLNEVNVVTLNCHNKMFVDLRQSFREISFREFDCVEKRQLLVLQCLQIEY